MRKYPSSPSIRLIRVAITQILGILGLLGILHAHPKSSLLWKISGNGLKSPSYLYGTVHSFDERAFRFAKIAESYIAKCDAFGMEINMENLGGIDLFGMMKYITMPGDTTLQMLMTPQQYAKLDTFVRDSLHLSLAMFNKIKPMFLAGMGEELSMSHDSSEFLDMYFMKKAKEHHKEIIGIETIEEQVRALDLIPLKEQAKMVLEMVEPDTTKAAPNSAEDLVDIYARGDLDAIYAFYKKEDLSNTFNAALITDRNRRMAQRIDSIIHKKTLFTAIGALHLPGEEGVLNLLRKKGYTLEPIISESIIPSAPNKVCEALIDLDYSGYVKVYDKPNGKVIQRLKQNVKDESWLVLSIIKDSGNYFYGYIGHTSGEPEDTIGWIKKEKYIGTFARNYVPGDTLFLYKNANLKSGILSIVLEWTNRLYTIIKSDGDWAYVRININGKIKEGWLSPNMQCANPFTTCN
jgi:uncharacterized protein YbaP (TraB family)